MTVWLGWMLACVADQDTGSGGTVGSTTETGASTSTGGTTLDDLGVGEVQARLADAVPTVVVVEWSSSLPGTAWIEYGEGDAFDLATPPVEVGSEVRTDLLLGLPQDFDVQYRVVHAHDGGRTVTEPATIHTGTLSIDAPDLELVAGDPAATATPWVLLSESDDASTVVVVDRQGRVVWGIDRSRQRATGMVRAMPDGSGVMLLEGDKWREKDTAQLVQVAWDGTEVQVIPVSYAHHSFVFLPDGTLGVLAADLRELDPYGTVAGDRIVEVAPDGTQRVVWSTWDDIEPVYDPQWEGVFYGEGMDWTHANGIFYSPDRDTYLFSMLHLGQVAEVDRGGAGIVGRYGGADGYPPTDPAAAWDDQHGPSWSPEGTLLFAGNLGTETHAFEFEVDDAAQVLVPRMVYGDGLGIYANSGGLAQRLDGGGTWVQFGSAGVFHELDAAGATVWEMQTVPVANVTSAFPLAGFYGE